MLGRILSEDNSKSRRAALDDDEMGSEAAMMIVAGSDSTAATLTYAVWEVLRHPILRQQVEDEVAALPPGFTAKEVEALPLLGNVLEEVLRLYNPTGAPVERLVPPGGISVDGWDIPGGTTVYTQSWLLSRLEGVFPQPEK
jgi:cytochrome P450